MPCFDQHSQMDSGRIFEDFQQKEKMEKGSNFNRSDPLKWKERIRLIPAVVFCFKKVVVRQND